jgi:hypothetical protein
MGRWGPSPKPLTPALTGDSAVSRRPFLCLRAHARREAAEVLDRRASLLRKKLADLEDELAGGPGPQPPRVTLLEIEYLRAVTAAELGWVRGVVDDLRSSALTWSGEELAEASKGFLPE